jgi:hypothetical protein
MIPNSGNRFSEKIMRKIEGGDLTSFVSSIIVTAEPDRCHVSSWHAIVKNENGRCGLSSVRFSAVRTIQEYRYLQLTERDLEALSLR